MSSPTSTLVGDDLESKKKFDSELPHDDPAPVNEPFSRWSFREKLLIIGMTGSGSLLSSLSANIYFPSIPSIAADLNVSVAQVNFTITSYLILQGLSPMVFGPMADSSGRRLVYLICLAISFAACIGMAFLPSGKSAYPLLLLLRCVQSTGSATMISLGIGSITDIATPGERGFLAALVSLGTYCGPAIGPVAGGLIAGTYGWRGIFFFMSAFSLTLAIVILLFLPETLRAIVHAGEIMPPRHLRPLIPVLAKYDLSGGTSFTKPSAKPKRPSPTFLRWPDALLMLACNALSFGLFQGLMSSISPVLVENYHFLTETTLGLCFLPVGIATTIGGIATGKLIDREFRREAGMRIVGNKIPLDFDIEKARLRLLPLFVFVAATGTLGYGWTAGRTPIFVPLFCTFIYGSMGFGTSAVVQQILMDLTPGQGASVAAATNLFRCLWCAVVVSTQDPIRGWIGTGGVMTVTAGVTCLILPLTFFERKYGMGWRKQRAERQEMAAMSKDKDQDLEIAEPGSPCDDDWAWRGGW